jgi:hypothetical protein
MNFLIHGFGGYKPSFLLVVYSEVKLLRHRGKFPIVFQSDRNCTPPSRGESDCSSSSPVFDVLVLLAVALWVVVQGYPIVH